MPMAMCIRPRGSRGPGLARSAALPAARDITAKRVNAVAAAASRRVARFIGAPPKGTRGNRLLADSHTGRHKRRRVSAPYLRIRADAVGVCKVIRGGRGSRAEWKLFVSLDPGGGPDTIRR